ncbi:MAG: n-acetylglutamate synthase [Acidobacteriota bacterium]|nr:n-acetylglutamate synthase [Acidobacteriota bacterium]
MTNINYNKKRFRSTNSSLNQTSDSNTIIYRFRQKKDLVWGNYRGGGIRFGLLIGKVNDDGSLDMRYQHIKEDDELRIGKCRAVPEQTVSGTLRLKEFWQWLDDEAVEGVSIMEEIREANYTAGS